MTSKDKNKDFSADFGFSWHEALKCAILSHVKAEYPREACGLLVRFDGGETRYLPCGNVAADTAEYFEIDADDWAAAEDLGDVAAVVHSHPDGTPYLSGADRQMQTALGLPWVLASGNPRSGFTLHRFRACPHLRGRVFEYGVADCGSLIRDAYHLAGLDFADMRRGSIDGDIEAGIWLQCLKRCGAFQVATEHEELAAGDVILTTHGGRVAHAALYLGNGEILHHPLDGLSRREPYNGYWQRSTHSVWRHPRIRPDMVQAVLNDLAHSA